MVLAQSLPALGAQHCPPAIGVGALAGMVNGVVANLFQGPAFAVMLGTLGVLQALSLILSNQTTADV